MSEYMEVKGYGDTATWVYAQALEPIGVHDGSLITMQEVRQVHHIAMMPVWPIAPHPDAGDDEGPGHFRRHDIRPFSEGMSPPSWALVDARLRDWVDEVVASEPVLREPGEEPLAEGLARLHSHFEQVHPFIDGNGRVGRRILNLILVRLGYPPVIFLKRQRDAYLAALQRADRGDPGQLGELLARAMFDNLNRFIVPNLAGPAKLVPLAALVDADFSLVALRQAAQRGRLDALQGADGVWRSSRKAVAAYKSNKGRRMARG